MPWQESCAVDLRVRFIREHGLDRHSMTALCEAYGISRKTGYKWLGRYEAGGLGGGPDRSRAPLRHGRATSEAIVEAILTLKADRPSWGPRKLVARLETLHPGLGWPSHSTAHGILKRAGLVCGRKRRRRAAGTPGGLTEALGPNHLWAVDHKGWVALKNGQRCEPLTITDSFSRYLLAVSTEASTREAQARPVFEQAFSTFGLPQVIRSDNGGPFASSGLTGLTALSVWWLKLGIDIERIKPGRPQQNGRHERFHLTLLEAMQPPADNRQAQAERFAAFRHDYNEERPHQALGQAVPAKFYAPSPRPMPKRLPDPDYPSDVELRQVRSTGEIKWRGDRLHICSALAGETLAIEEQPDGDWCVRFYAKPIAIIDRLSNRPKRLQPAKPTDEPELSPIYPS
jgi:putative transposase